MGSIHSRNVISFFGAVVFARQNYAVMLHRFGKFERLLKPGINFKIPIVDSIAFVHDLREQCREIDTQVAITKDNVALRLDAILYYQIYDPYKASYGIEKLEDAITTLAQTSMRSEIGKLTLDKTFEERESLNHHIVTTIGAEVEAWGIKCIRYEIRDIDPPPNIKNSMILQAESERRKRANILKSEGERQASINVAEGERMSKKLIAEGNADAAIRIAKASSSALSSIGDSISSEERKSAASFLLADKYIAAYSKLGKKENSLIIDTSPIKMAERVTEAYNMLNRSLQSKEGKEILEELIPKEKKA